MGQSQKEIEVKRSVVINDDVTQLKVLAGLLHREGIEVLTFENAEAALTVMDPKEPPDLIVTDLYMPGIDGWRLCRLLRSPEYEAFNAVPILVVSATFAGDETSRITADLGANAFMPSPVDGKLFIEHVRALLRGERPRDRLRVLIVEDSKTLAVLLKKAFDAQGYLTDVALTAQEAVEAFKKMSYDVAILDYYLSDRKGDEILDDLQKSRPDCICIMMTTDPNPELALTWMRQGAAACLRKPFEPEYLIEMCVNARRERSLLRVEDLLEERTRELGESEEKYRLLVENASDAIFITQDEVIKFPNPQTENLIGYSREKLNGVSFISFIHPEDRAMALERHQRTLRGVESPNIYSFRIINRGGEERWVQLNTVLTDWEGRPATLNFLRDTTEQRKLESRVQTAQRMKALGTLSGGIAHNFNNVLMGIQGRASLMMMNKNSSHPDFEHLKGIEEYVQNAAELAKDLLGFARGGKYEVKPTDLNELIKHENRMFERTKKEISVHGKYDKRLWTAEVDQGQIQQVFLNLYVNAWQAMPGGGDLYVQTENVTLDEDYVKPFEIAPGRYVKISVTDTGVGMDEKTIEKIFEPFFTTRDMGRGTGLGLASVYGIVKNHGGFINVYSEKGEGTTFNIYLPVSEKEVEEEKKSPGEVLRGEGTILLVDDEQMITDVGEQLLEKLSYRVMIAKSGREAITVYEKNRADIDIVILDMIMPGMGGGDVCDRLKEINPEIKVLLSSGYSINGQAQEILDRGCNGFIQKPFTMKEISQKIREALDKR